jgi:glucose/arabinose dehydrogenase
MRRLLVQATLLAYLANGSLFGSVACYAQQPATNSVQLSLISDEFDLPVSITSNPFRPDELVVVERDGLAKSISKKDHSIREILDIEDLVHETHQHGLMSISYSNKVERGAGEFFANYIDTQGDLVIARFPDRAGKLVDDEQMSVVVKVAQITPNAHGSQVHTRLDNSLLITTGDGGEQPKKVPHAAQSSRSLLGKVLRVIPQTSGGYTSPKDNPFSADSAILPEIWARGFRNPEHISIDSENGSIFVIDNSSNYLEVNVVQAGKNYGWDEMEGSTCRESGCSLSSFTTPALSIPRSSPGARLIGGAVYRGKKVPSLTGQFIFAEVASATLFAAEPGTDQKLHYSPITTIPKKEISAIGQDVAGEVYVATRDGSLFEIGVRGN